MCITRRIFFLKMGFCVYTYYKSGKDDTPVPISDKNWILVDNGDIYEVVTIVIPTEPGSKGIFILYLLIYMYNK